MKLSELAPGSCFSYTIDRISYTRYVIAHVPGSGRTLERRGGVPSHLSFLPSDLEVTPEPEYDRPDYAVIYSKKAVGYPHPAEAFTHKGTPEIWEHGLPTV